MRLERRHCLCRKWNRLPSILRAHLRREMSDQRRNVFSSLPQRRQYQRKNIHPVKQILTEFLLAHPGFEIVMRRYHHPHIHAYRLIATNAFHFCFFQHPQQLRLHGQRHVANLIQKNCAVIGLLELSNMPSRCAGERSFLVPEKFRLNQLGRNRRAIQGHKRTPRARTAFVNRSRHQLFSCARFSQDADPRFTHRHALQLRHHALHGCALPYNLVLAQALLELPVFAFQPLQLQRILHREQKFFGGDRFLQKIQRARPRSPHRRFNVRLPRHHHDWRGYSLRLQFLEQRQSSFAEHHHIRKDQVEVLRLGQFQGLARVIAHRGLVPRQPERPRQRCQRVGFIVHNQQMCFRWQPSSESLTISARVLDWIRSPRQFDHECSAPPRLTLYVDSSPMIAYHGLNDSQPQPGAVLLACIIRSKDSLTLLRRQPRSCI